MDAPRPTRPPSQFGGAFDRCGRLVPPTTDMLPQDEEVHRLRATD
jgi:hypothetical protein